MTKREAKKYVCRVISSEIVEHIDNDSSWVYRDREVAEEDIPKVEEAIRELSDELYRRGT